MRSAWKRAAVGAAAVAAIVGLASTVYAALRLSLAPRVLLSAQTGAPGADSAAKTKLIDLEFKDVAGNPVRAQIAIFGDTVGGPGNEVWDFAGKRRVARDIFARRTLDGGQTWSAPVNLSNTALLSSIDADPDGDGPLARVPYFGDSGKPQVFGKGKNVLVLWEDKFSKPMTDTASPTSTSQFRAVYPEAQNLEVPFSVLCAVRSVDGGETWGAPEQLTDGTRDVAQYSTKGSGVGFGIVWQEDPFGLQPGQAEGPGDGGSGAKVSHGTDVWYSALTTAPFQTLAPFRAGLRVTDNFTKFDPPTGGGGTGVGSGTSPSGEAGQVGASRPNLTFLGTAATTTVAVVAYEETKGLLKTDEGKYVRYHTFPAFTYVELATTGPHGGPSLRLDDGQQNVGWIISQPDLNGRRVRLVTQNAPGAQSGVVLNFLWKEGDFDQGGPSDILCRNGYKNAADPLSTGLRPEDLVPAVSPLAGDPAVARTDNEPALNLSSRRGLLALPDDDPIEDARAHRAIIRDDFIAVAYTRTDDGAVARYTDLDHYNLFVRRSFDGGFTWDAPRNISQLTDTTISVREPRLIQTPLQPDGSQSDDVFYVAWGTELNQYEHISQGTIDLDLFVTRTTDRGASYEPTLVLAGTGNLNESEADDTESQIRCSADGASFSAVWMETDALGLTETYFRSGIEVEVPDEVPVSTGGGGGGACQAAPAPEGSVPLGVLVVLAVAAGAAGARRRRAAAHAHARA